MINEVKISDEELAEDEAAKEPYEVQVYGLEVSLYQGWLNLH